MVRAKQQGFTLIEMLVAVAVFAMISAVSFVTLSNTVRVRDITDKHAHRIAEIQRIFMLIERDVLQMAPRAILNEENRIDPAFMISTRPYKGFYFTRGGYRNPGQLTRSSLKRVGYFVKEDQLWRQTWNVLDRSQQSLPEYEESLLDGVNELDIEVYETGWTNKWPPKGNYKDVDVNDRRPRALRIGLDVEDYGEFEISLPVSGNK